MSAASASDVRRGGRPLGSTLTAASRSARAVRLPPGSGPVAFCRQDFHLLTGSYLDPREAEMAVAEYAQMWVDGHPGKRQTVTNPVSAAKLSRPPAKRARRAFTQEISTKAWVDPAPRRSGPTWREL